MLFAACGGGGGFPDAPPAEGPPPTGTFSLTWSVVDQDSQPIACDRIGASAMTVLAHNLAYDGGETQIFSCATATGSSQPMVPGTYEMGFELASSLGVLATGAKQTPVEILPNENTELSPVTFQVEAVGGVSLKVDSGKSGGNCGATSAGGAGIDLMSITLTRNSDGACAPITLAISAGPSQTGGTYTVDCTTPVERACIENDQVLTATGIDSDAYTIRVRGKVAGNVCWTNNDSLQVPPLQKTLLRTLNLALQTQTPGCQ